MGASLSWSSYDNSYIRSSASGVSAVLVCMALYPQITCRHCSKFSVAPLSIWMSQKQYSKLIGCFWFTQARWEVAGQLQLHCLSRLNPFIPCVCKFTYLPSVIIFTADTSTFSHPCCSVKCSCQSRMWACQYTEIHGEFRGVHESQKLGCDKHRVNDTDTDT